MQLEGVKEVVASSDQAAGRTGKRALLASVLVGLFLAAMDSTVVGTLLPAIKAEMQDVTLYPWLLSGFILASVLATPVVGRAADVFGQRRTLVAVLGIFLVGSLAVCISSSMTSLVFARALQGVGAGGVSVMTYITVGKLYSERERGKMQGMLSMVWGLAAVIGPLVGALVYQKFGWRMVFALNIPLSFIAMALVWSIRSTDQERGQKAEGGVDARVMALFSVTLASLLILILQPSVGLSPGVSFGLGAAMLIGLGLSVVYLRKWPEKSLLPVEFFTRRDYVLAALLTVVASIALYASVTLLPLYLRATLSTSTVSSGLIVMVAALGWVVGSAICGASLVRTGYKATALLGTILLAAGTGVLALGGGPLPVFAAAQALIGLGIGFVATTTLVFVQNISPLPRLGAYTSAVHLFRNIGAALGINTVAAIQIFSFKRLQLSNPGIAYQGSFKWSFIALFAAAAAAVVAALWMPRRVSRTA
ncbi:MFS transporter [Vitiosangium sp. GDMCC 1.1324]|uniref:MFS transporter n=1 Tax=Vitiosangium sp. (strain GDMCC 1.1324) TaxID=2138576 RepID=UPI00130EAAB7|nr:MFS transporter [Vitiosangium sp. GDMCC 1.1324]